MMKRFLVFVLFFMVGCCSDEEGDDIVDLSMMENLIKKLSNQTLGVKMIQDRVYKLQYSKARFDGNNIVNKLSKTISEKINIHIEALKRTKTVVEKVIEKEWPKRESSLPSCCRYKATSLYFDLGFQTKIDDTQGCEVISDSSPRYVTSIPNEVMTVMKENRRNVPSLKWQYIGSEEGVFTLFPAVDKPFMCGGTNYDPRMRPWYVEAASHRSKHVIVLLDSSYSMAQTHAGIQLMEIAKKTIEKVMETLNPKDKLGIVAFNDTSYYPKNCYGQSLAIATPVNIATLKKEFLMKLKPGGQSNYAAGFKAAFKLMESSWNASKEMKIIRPSLRSKFDCTLLFITDGGASEVERQKVDAIFRAIRNGNSKVRNIAKIYAYGVGRKVNITLLDKIVSQNFTGILPEIDYNNRTDRLKPPKQGYVYYVDDASLLRNNMSFIYEKSQRENGTTEPSFSIPYFDSAGLGLIFTAGFPVYKKQNNGNVLFGVVAIDIALDDLLENAIEFKKDARSYVFVIDNTGRVLIHPLMPHPKHHVNAPSFIQIDALERDEEFHPVMLSMMKGKSGTMSFSSQRVAPAGDCNWVFNVNQTYFWKPIEGTKFSVCFVEEMTDYSAKLPPNIAAECNYRTHREIYGEEGAPNQYTYQYHRLDLTQDKEICRHFYQISTVSKSVVKFASSAFRNPIKYETLPETKENVTNINRFFNRLIQCKTKLEATKILEEERIVADMFVSDAISDVLWTTFAETFWFKTTTFSNHIIRRFIATPSGVIRFHPGTNLTQTYDPTKRFWYELALTRQGMIAFSPPYKDAAGAGNVVTMSHTIHTPIAEGGKEFPYTDESKVIAVIGMDLSLDYLYYEMVKMYPKCENVWLCQFVNLRGYVVMHPDYLNLDAAKRQRHITGDDSILAKMLLESGEMFRAACLDLDSNDYKVSYVIKPHTQLNTMNSSNICKRYFMKEIKHTNLFFVAEEHHKHCFKTSCRKNNLACYQHDVCFDKRMLPNICECPCTTPLVVDTCVNYILYMNVKVTYENNKTADLAIPPCFPNRPSSGVVASNCVPSHLKSCMNPGCTSISDRSTCAGVVGCTWCWRARNGGQLEYPFCTDSDICYNGYQNTSLPGFSNLRDSCEVGNDNTVLLAAILSVVGLIVFVLITIIIFLYCYFKKNKTVDTILKNQEEYDEVATLSAALGISSTKSLRKHSLGSIGARTKRRGTRLASISSQVSSQQKTAGSHQVVLSIVDSSGSEIARSQPRPVQIIHGNRPGSSSATIGAPKDEGTYSGNSNALSAVSENSYTSTRDAIHASSHSIADLAQRSRSRPCSRPISPLQRPTWNSSKSAPNSPRSSARNRQRPPFLSNGLRNALRNINHTTNISPSKIRTTVSSSNFKEIDTISNEVDSAYSDESIKTQPEHYGDEQFEDYVAVGMDGTITPAMQSIPNSPVHFKFDKQIIEGPVTWDSFDRIESTPSPITRENEQSQMSDHAPHSPKTLFDLPQYDEFSLNYIKSNMSALLSDLDSNGSDTYHNIRKSSTNKKNKTKVKKVNSDETNLSEIYSKINSKKKSKDKHSDSGDEGFAIYV